MERINVAEGEVKEAREGYELIAHLAVCCGIVISNYNGKTAMGHTMRPENDRGIIPHGRLGDYITPHESIDALLQLFGEIGVSKDTLKAHLFGCTGSTIAQATAEEARQLLATYKIPLTMEVTGLGAMRLRVTPRQAVIEFLDSADPIKVNFYAP